MLGKCHHVTDGMVLESAYALADYTQEQYPQLIFPPISALQQATRVVTTRVLQQAIREDVVTAEIPEELDTHIEAFSWKPRYLPFRQKA